MKNIVAFFTNSVGENESKQENLVATITEQMQAVNDEWSSRERDVFQAVWRQDARSHQHWSDQKLQSTSNVIANLDPSRRHKLWLEISERLESLLPEKPYFRPFAFYKLAKLFPQHQATIWRMVKAQFQAMTANFSFEVSAEQEASVAHLFADAFPRYRPQLCYMVFQIKHLNFDRATLCMKIKLLIQAFPRYAEHLQTQNPKAVLAEHFRTQTRHEMQQCGRALLGTSGVKDLPKDVLAVIVAYTGRFPIYECHDTQAWLSLAKKSIQAGPQQDEKSRANVCNKIYASCSIM